MVREALIKCGRADLIGNGKDCLVRPETRFDQKGGTRVAKSGEKRGQTDRRKPAPTPPKGGKKSDRPAKNNQKFKKK
jgi:hypothetical protein